MMITIMTMMKAMIMAIAKIMIITIFIKENNSRLLTIISALDFIQNCVRPIHGWFSKFSLRGPFQTYYRLYLRPTNQPFCRYNLQDKMFQYATNNEVAKTI